MKHLDKGSETGRLKIKKYGLIPVNKQSELIAEVLWANENLSVFLFDLIEWRMYILQRSAQFLALSDEIVVVLSKVTQILADHEN